MQYITQTTPAEDNAKSFELARDELKRRGIDPTLDRVAAIVSGRT